MLRKHIHLTYFVEKNELSKRNNIVQHAITMNKAKGSDARRSFVDKADISTSGIKIHSTHNGVSIPM